MTFSAIIETWGIGTLAADLMLPTKNVRRWVDEDSIPAGWFVAISRAAKRRGYQGVTVRALAEIAEARRLSRAEKAAA